MSIHFDFRFFAVSGFIGVLFALQYKNLSAEFLPLSGELQICGSSRRKSTSGGHLLSAAPGARDMAYSMIFTLWPGAFVPGKKTQDQRIEHPDSPFPRFCVALH